MYKKKWLYWFIVVCIVAVIVIAPLGNFALGHSGRTDSAGGHKDNKNKSGLGGYHYHCGGHPPHLHSGGICPYSAKSSNSAGSSSSKSGGSSSNTTANPIQIKNQKSNIVVGEEYILEVSATDGSTAYTYTSSEPTVAEVTPEGKVIAHAVGKTEITIKTSVGKTRSFTLAVKEVAATSIAFEVSADTHTLYVGQSYIPTVVFTPENTTNKEVGFSSSDESVVSVAGTNFSANKEGTATITATSANGTIATLTIVVEQILPTGIQIATPSITLFLGDSHNLSYEVFPADATNTTVHIQADDEKVVDIKENTITGLTLGETTLVLTTHNGITAEILVSVVPIPVSAMQIKTDASTDKKVFRLTKDEVLPISVIIEPKNATNKSYEWHIENPAIAEVIDGHVVFKGYGKTKITASHETFTDSIEVVYYNPFWATMLRIFVIALLLATIIITVRRFWIKRKARVPAPENSQK